jgi:hypothetical protein
MEKIKMNEMSSVGYTVVDKNGNVLDDAKFSDYDELADHMLEMADKWYKGEYSADDQLKISAFDETGEVVYSDVATYGEASDEDSVPDHFELTSEGIPTRRKKAQGFAN